MCYNMDKSQLSPAMSVPSLADPIAHLTAAAEESRELVVAALARSQVHDLPLPPPLPVARWAQLLREPHGVALATGTVENLCRSVAAEANRQRPTVRLAG